MARINISDLHSEAKENATNLNRFDDGLSSALIITEGSMSLVTEITGGLEEKRGNAYGINIQPGYFITNEIQLVTRLQLAGSPSDNGLNAQRRYEREVGLAKGDFYQAVSLGANYHIARHRIKLMTGVEYAAMEDADSWTVFTAFRVFFGPHSKGPFPMAQLLNGRY